MLSVLFLVCIVSAKAGKDSEARKVGESREAKEEKKEKEKKKEKDYEKKDDEKKGIGLQSLACAYVVVLYKVPIVLIR